MGLKIKHKMTFDYSDQRIAVGDFNRSNKKTKTMLHSFYGNKDCCPQTLLNSVSSDQQQIKTLVQTKIEQLHQKMKTYFSQQRKTHLQEIAPQMEQLKSSILQLREQLSRPKSMQEIEQEKHNLLKRKILLLKEMDNINKNLNENKKTFYDVKFQWEELLREMANGKATVEKYKRKLSDRARNSGKDQSRNSCTKHQETGDHQGKGLENILNDSLYEEPSDNIKEPACSQTQRNSAKAYNQSDHIHITQIIPQKSSHQVAHKLPRINSRQNLINMKYLSKISHTNISSSSKQKFNEIQNYHSMTPCLLTKNKHNIQLSKHGDNYQKENSLRQVKKSNKMSNSTYEDILKNHTLPTNYGGRNETGVGMPHNVKSINNKQYEFDFIMEMRRYDQLINKEKWKKISDLFRELDDQTYKDKQNNLIQQENTPHSEQSKQNHVSNLQELLMEQLRKRQYSRFQQKGYHQGLKHKTHQIRFDLKKVFKNYSTDEFFDDIMKKKPIKKQLAAIWQNALN